jgi:uncharacterized protein DUF3597
VKNKCRIANAYASFRRHFASAKLHSCARVTLASFAATVKLKQLTRTGIAGQPRPFPFGEQSMSIFGKIMGAIFGHSAAATPAGGAAAPAGGGGAAAGSAGAGSASSAPAPAPAGSVDVAAIVDKAAAAKHEKLEWRTSIVDLMKALDIDSSLAARKELAKELGYTGDTNDSASMNVWLHKQVMAKLAANGGKLPPEIKH